MLHVMPNRSRSPKAEDGNKSAFRAIQSVTSLTESSKPKRAKRKNPAAVALGRKGGLKGGHARAASMTAEERAESARKAAIARWGNREE